MTRFLSIGEAMIELSEEAPLWAMNVAGDTLNTAWHFRALAGDAAQVAYLTRLGTDPFSDRIATFIAAAGIGTGFLQRDPDRGPGLYAISLTKGERSFTYWRETSAAKLLAEDSAALDRALGWADQIYFSGITLAILSPAARDRLFAALTDARGGTRRIIFDPNLRPRLWEDAATMRATVMRAAALSDVVLPSFDDEAAWFGDTDLAACARRYGAEAGREVVVKNGGRNVLVAMDGQLTEVPLTPVEPVDTSGAGDSFNAGWLFARLSSADAGTCTAAAHALASQVIGRKGALG
ncbi:sugar kinase [Neotabrizicola sp. VNH66]|uniref:sugar kinase n=1 Tax=Neotabrizicola sp. VNH66 TaxID=3400918 RepID=UPI003BFF9C2A